MNGLDLLREDHKRVNQLFNEVESETELSKRREICNEIRSELELHMNLEETVLYAFLAKKDEFQDQIEHSYDEHQEAKSVLMDIQTARDENEFDNLVGELVKSVRHHVREEENTLFPKIEKSMKPDELDTLGRRLQEMKPMMSDQSMAA